MYEVPPTAGLPLRWQDLLPGRGDRLAAGLEALTGLTVQIECSGTACLVLALNALRTRSRRSRVVIPAYTCPLVPLAIRHAGLQVELCDLAPGHYDFSPDALDAVCGPDTLAVIPTHLGGRVADVAGALRIAGHAGASVVEDAAQALGARSGDKPVGTLGDAGFFSLAVGKGLTTFEGGVLVARNSLLGEAVRVEGARLTRRQSLIEIRRSLELLAYAASYNPFALTMTYGWPLRHRLRRGNLLAAVGDDLNGNIPLHRVSAFRLAIAGRALDRLQAFHECLEIQARDRCAQLQALPGVRVLADAPGDRGVWPLLMVLMPGVVERDAVLADLWGSGLGVGRMFLHAVPDYPYLKQLVPAVDVPNARSFAARMLTVSNSPWLDEARFATVLASIGAAAQRGHY